MNVSSVVVRRTLGLILLLSGGCAAVAGAWIPVKAQVAQVLLEVAWTRTMRTAPSRPWPWADTVPVARLTIPRLRRDQIVLSGASGRTMAFGPAKVDGTGAPGTGNCVITGHRDTSFRGLDRLRGGDLIVVEDSTGRAWRYRVTSARVVDSRDTSVLEGSTSARLTLITCYPLEAITAGAAQRYVVDAELES